MNKSLYIKPKNVDQQDLSPMVTDRKAIKQSVFASKVNKMKQANKSENKPLYIQLEKPTKMASAGGKAHPGQQNSLLCETAPNDDNSGMI